jgi:replication-associated recombination protein RarA
MKNVNFLVDFEPRRLSEVVGYDAEVELMNRWLRSDNFPRGILFSGDIGVGKTMLANLLATAAACLNRAKGSAEPCGQCQVCRNYINGNVERYQGSKIDADWLLDKFSWMSRPGADEWCFKEHGRWHPLLIDEIHELKQAAQKILRAEVEMGWRESFLIGTASDLTDFDTGLCDRMRPLHIMPPSKTPLTKWVVEIWQKAGHEVKPAEALSAAGVLYENTKGRFRALLKVLQQIHDTGDKLTVEDVRKACQFCGYGK